MVKEAGEDSRIESEGRTLPWTRMCQVEFAEEEGRRAGGVFIVALVTAHAAQRSLREWQAVGPRLKGCAASRFN